MVFHITRPLDVGGERRAALELVEDHPVGLAHHSGEHVQAPPVGHADHYFVAAEGSAALDDLLHGRDHGFGAVEAEPLGAGEALVQEALQAFRLDQLLQDGDLALLGEGDLLVLAFDPLLDPGLLLRIGDVHVLHAEVAAVGAPDDGQNLAQGRGFETQHVVEEDRAVVVLTCEAVVGRIEFGVVGLRLDAEGVEVGLQMPTDAEGADHHDRADAVEGGGADLVGGGRRLLLGDDLSELGLHGGP